MKMLLDIAIDKPDEQIGYVDGIMLVGSCFTEHIGGRLEELKFRVMQNPNGIVFDPSTVSSSLINYIENRQYTGDDLFYLNELWQSWQHHSRYSGVDKDEVLTAINDSFRRAHDFLKQAKWLIITLGTSFSYRLTEGMRPVANCHRAPASWFTRHLMTIDETVSALDISLYRLFQFNNDIQVVFTVSPVRHIRDGVVANNRSKARLIESVHHLADKFGRLHYFPSYELVIDVLRDYRFYDTDLVHPNYQATAFVLEEFMKSHVGEASRKLAEEIDKIIAARKHKPFYPSTEAHRRFLDTHAARTRALMEAYPFLNLREELDFFSGRA